MKLFLFFLLTLPALAELPPQAYLLMQKAAAEEIEIKVEKVKRGTWISPGEVVNAKVTKVVRSKSGLKVGDKITIRYRYKKLRGVGPSPIPKLKKGDTLPAWLQKTEKGHFKPFAGGFSFKRVENKN